MHCYVMCMSYEFLMQLFKWEFFSVKYVSEIEAINFVEVGFISL